MNPQDSEIQIEYEESLDDLGILIISDAQCEEIEQILVICKYCIIGTFFSGIGIMIYFLLIRE